MLQRPTASSGFSHVVIDVETRSNLDLTEVGASRYAAHPSTKVLVVAFTIDEEEDPEIWLPTADPMVPARLIAAAGDPDVTFVAHNAAFEIEVCRSKLAHFGLPEIPLERWVDTMTAALALALPANLENLAIALEIKHRKDAVGVRLMRQMTRPESAAQDSSERLQALGQYCARDVLATREAFYVLPALTPEEQALWILNQRICRRGIHFDRVLTVAARDIAEKARSALNTQLAAATGGELTTTSQVARLVRWLCAHGAPVRSAGKDVIDALLASELSPEVRTVVELRQAGAGSATSKFDAVINGLETDNRARQLFRWHGASTGRASSHRIQIHNLKRTALKDPEAAIAAVLSGDLERVHAIDAPLSLLANILRPLICAAPGNVLVGADLSMIESRLLAYFAREERKLEIFRNYDRTGDPKYDPYATLARLLNPANPDRHLGKIYDLAFGYQGGVRAFRSFEPDKLHRVPDEKVEQAKFRWRALHPNTERWWHGLEGAAIAAVFRPGETTRADPVRFKQLEDFLYLELPSGRLIAYPHPRLEYDDRRRKRVVFKDNAGGGWRDDSLYGGQLAENVVSGAARDLLTAAMLRIEAAGIPIIAHIHDELICEVPEGTADLELLHKLMVEAPPWAPDLPIAAKVWTGRRYVK
jgi:DNA polymerase bacteriophage-type